MKKNIVFILMLGCTGAFGSSVDTANAVLDASRVIRIKHASSDQLSLNDYNTLGSVRVREISVTGDKTKLKMSYSGPADYCDYELTVTKKETVNVVTVDKEDCSE